MQKIIILVCNPAEVRICLVMHALILKSTFSGGDPRLEMSR